MTAVSIDRGDVFWVEADDARGPAPSYAHPHVVLQDDVFNHSRVTTVIVCAPLPPRSCLGRPGER